MSRKHTLKRYACLRFGSWESVEGEVRQLFDGVESAVTLHIVQPEKYDERMKEPDAETAIGRLHELFPSPSSDLELYLYLTVAESWE